MPIREWPESTRPRERLVARGASSLSDDELLALLIGSGTRGRSALLIANEVLRAIGGTRALGQADVSRLRECGAGVATGVRVAAACELGRRVIAASADGERCDTAELAAAALAPHFTHLERESLVVGLLSRKHRLMAVVPVYVGNVAGTSVRIAEALHRGGPPQRLGDPAGAQPPVRRSVAVRRRSADHKRRGRSGPTPGYRGRRSPGFWCRALGKPAAGRPRRVVTLP